MLLVQYVKLFKKCPNLEEECDVIIKKGKKRKERNVGSDLNF